MPTLEVVTVAAGRTPLVIPDSASPRHRALASGSSPDLDIDRVRE